MARRTFRRITVEAGRGTDPSALTLREPAIDPSMLILSTEAWSPGADGERCILLERDHVVALRDWLTRWLGD